MKTSMKVTLPIAAVLAASLWISPAGAAPPPPASGSFAPLVATPEPVTFGYVGAAFVKPYRNCTSRRADDATSVVTSCPSTTSSRQYVGYGQVRVRSAAGGFRQAWKSRPVSNDGTLYLTVPFARGWQWLWSPGQSPLILPANSLVKASLLSF